ncbi:MAG: tRNA (adenosine(37)-N6)-threonylcarbamoyltransferase complex transferase subunit TsaD [Rhodospirillales bacterium]|nr:MAG: tRNA (adenosine(37)-N6)-threonylcarbamoyltransferase complex transferase subunit TsaD [Rhodospirillales bacterium]
MIVLGIETSCDETAAALVADDRHVLSNIVLSQIEEHRPYLGVVPEIAARSHLDHLDRLIARTLGDARCGWNDIAGIAATAGPGLIGGVLVGLTTAKAIALARNLPLIAVNHLEAHALTARLTDGVDFPYLLLLVSGGHCQLLAVEGVGRFRPYGGTVDDAAGEAFDKTAALLRLGYPGGPAVEAAAQRGDPARFDLPRPMAGRPGCDFSFSGLKTAVRHAVAALPGGTAGADDAADLAAAFQEAVADVLADRTRNAISRFRADFPAGTRLIVAGGVAANAQIRRVLADTAAQHGLDFVAPPAALCTDNAAMVAWAGLERLQAGLIDGLDVAARPRWPLAALTAAPGATR